MEREREVRAFAYEQADRYRGGELGRDEAIAAIRARFPELTEGAARDAFAQGLFESR